MDERTRRVCLAALAGLIYEGMCALWVGCVARGQPVAAGGLATLCALAVVVGVTEGGRSRAAGVAYALGCGVGAGVVTALWPG